MSATVRYRLQALRWFVVYPAAALWLLFLAIAPQPNTYVSGVVDVTVSHCEKAMAQAQYVVAQGGVTTPAMLDYVQAECVR